MPRHTYLLQILVISVTLACGSAAHDLPSSSMEVLNLLTNNQSYNIRDRPQPINKGPLPIITNVYVYFIGSLDAQNLEFTAQLLVGHKWEDRRLCFNTSVARRQYIHGEAWLKDLIWTPSVYFVNERDNIAHENVYVAIFPNGTVFYNYRVKMRIFCAMRLHKFPFDKQRCTLVMESWMYTANDLVLQWAENSPVVVKHSNLPEYKLIKTSTNTSENSYPRAVPGLNTLEDAIGEEEDVSIEGMTSMMMPAESPFNERSFSALLIDFDFEREVGHYIMDYYVPSILLVVTSWVSFWLDPNAVPGRITLGTSTMLTFITLTRNTGSALPKVSYIKAVEIWFIVCTAFIFGSLVEFAFVNTIWRRKKDVQLKKVNSKYILKSTLTPRMARKNLGNRDAGSTSNGDFHTLSLEQVGSSGQLTMSSMDSALSGSHLSVSSCGLSEMDMDTVITLPVPTNIDGNYSEPPPQPKGFFTMTPQEIAAWIDRRSRVLFPAGFVLFNILYWSMVWL